MDSPSFCAPDMDLHDDKLYPLEGWQIKEMIYWITSLRAENEELKAKLKQWDVTHLMFTLSTEHLINKCQITQNEVKTLSQRLQRIDKQYEANTTAHFRVEWKRGSWFSTPTTRAFLHTAEDFFEARKHQKALVVLDKFLAEVIPSIYRVEAKLLKAVILRDCNLHARALTQCQEAMQTCGEHIREIDGQALWCKALFYYGLCLFDMDRNGEAMVAFSCAANEQTIADQAEIWLEFTSARVRMRGSGASNSGMLDPATMHPQILCTDTKPGVSSPTSTECDYSAFTFFEVNDKKLPASVEIEEAPVQIPPAKEITVEEAPVEEVPVEKAPVEKVPVEVAQEPLPRFDSVPTSPKSLPLTEPDLPEPSEIIAKERLPRGSVLKSLYG